MGKWDRRLDFMSIRLVIFIFTGFIIYIVISCKLKYIASLNENAFYISIGTDLLFYFDYIVSFFTIIASSTMFEETYRKPARSYICSLPLSIHELWTWRYFRLLSVVSFITIPALLFGSNQVILGITEFIERFHVEVHVQHFPIWQIVIRTIISINFSILITQIFLILFRNRIIVCAILFSYLIMEAGPWRQFLREYAWFYGSFSPIPSNLTVFGGREYIILLSLVFEAIIPIWFTKNYRLNKNIG